MKCIKCNSDKPVSLSIGANAVSLVSWCPDCGYTWTKGAAEEIATLQSQLAASQERERILREGLEKYADHHYWDARTSIYNDYWKPISNGYDIAERTLKAAEEVK